MWGIVCFLNYRSKNDQNKSLSQIATSKTQAHQRWSLDFVVMENLYSLAISTDDHEISIYGKIIEIKNRRFNIRKDSNTKS